MRDFLPRAAARRLSLAARLGRVFEAWGYRRIITPVFECADVLERGLGGDARAAAIRFVEPGTGEVVALRPDITAQVARLVATRLAEHEGPVRLCYEGAVYRLSGRLADEVGQREIIQAGVELIDMPGQAGDAEVLAVAAASLAAAELPETRLDVGHVAPVRWVLDAAGRVSDELRDDVAAALAKKDRAKLRALAAKMVASKEPRDAATGSAGAAASKDRGDAVIMAPLVEVLASLWGPAEPTLARALALPWPAEVREALEQLRAVLARFVELADPPAPSVVIDLGDVRGFDYYTGVRFAGYAGGAPDAVLRGGRYDTLIGRYGRPARATGFAIDVEGLAQAQRAIELPVAIARGIAVHGAGAPALARALRDRAIRAVTCEAPPTASWLVGAGFDAAVFVERGELLRANGSRETVAVTADGLVKLLGGT